MHTAMLLGLDQKSSAKSKAILQFEPAPLIFCTNNEHYIINLAAVVGRRMAISPQHKALGFVRHMLF